MKVPSIGDLARRPLGGDAGQHLATALNAVEYLRFGGLDTGEEPSPYEVVARTPGYRLRRYFTRSDATEDRMPVLLVPPLMLTADVWDVSPTTSAVALLDGEGLDPWVIDFGDPGREPGGKTRNVTDHVLALSEAIDRIREITGQDLHIGGYSQGGLFCYQAAALRRSAGISSIFALGSPMEPLSFPWLLSMPDEVVAELDRLAIKVLSRTGLPGWAAGGLFRWVDPVLAVKTQLQYFSALRDREALLPREKQRRYLSKEGWITFPGPAIAEVMETMTNERFVRGGLVFGERTSTLADITCPILIFTGQYDGFAPAPAVRDITKAAPKADIYECSVPTGHFGIGVGSRARRVTWPTVAQWARWTAAGGERPEAVGPVLSSDLATTVPPSSATGLSALMRTTTRMAFKSAMAAPGAAVGLTTHAAEAVGDLTREAVEQLPRVLRMERIGPATRVSYGLMLDQLAAARPDEVGLLFEDRAFTHGEVKDRLDDVVARLLAAGVRRGEHVGVLMRSGVHLLTAVAALSRLGAVAILLRPDADSAEEARIGQVTHLLVDRHHAARAATLGPPVLAVGARPDRDLHGATNLETLDVSSVRPPRWYRPNPGRGRDLAFVLFTDAGGRIRATPVTNRRWGLSALGAASSAALTPSDTVYSASPIYHASGLLLATAGPAAAGSRIAIASHFDPQTFWTDVRRYGATVVPYTWGMLGALLDAPPQVEEQHHPIRLFVGSGIPRSVWRRVLERFEPAGVLELFAVARTSAILANVSGRKIGSAGRSLPGTSRIRIAAVDPATNELALDADGFAQEADVDEPGILLVEAERDQPSWDTVPLRGVFDDHDSWVHTGELFRRDADGDLWNLGRANADLRTASGVVRPKQVEDALAEHRDVDLAVCHAVDGDDGLQAVVAVRTIDGATLEAAELNRLLGTLPVAARPDVVHLVDAIPLTSWFRPDVAALRAGGTPVPTAASPVFRRDARGSYRRARAAKGTS